MSGQPTTQMQISEWDPENPNAPQKSIRLNKIELPGGDWTKIGFILTLLMVMMLMSVGISVAFFHHEQHKMEHNSEFKHNLTLQSSMNSLKVKIERFSKTDNFVHFEHFTDLCQSHKRKCPETLQ